jgi:thiamine-phosphate pyrophosphorylase
MKTISIKGLYAITPDSADCEALLCKVEAGLAGGARVIQYRNKTEGAQHLDMATGIAALCRRFNAVFIVNDDVELALKVGADGVHLGRDDGDIAPARAKLGDDRIIGVSCYGSLERALAAQAAGADYVAFGSMFPSSTKPQAPHAPLSLLTEARQALQVPIVAIGGITLHNAPQVVDAGADAIAVISAVFDTPDIAQTAQAFSKLF